MQKIDAQIILETKPTIKNSLKLRRNIQMSFKVISLIRNTKSKYIISNQPTELEIQFDSV